MEKATSEPLGDGTSLVILKLEYLKTHSNENLFALLNALRNSIVLVPCVAAVTSEDEKRLIRGEELTEDAVHLRPEFVTAPNGKRWFPIFSQERQIPDSAAKRYTIIRMEVPQCIELAYSAKSLEGLVLDAFTKPLLLPFSVLMRRGGTA